VNRQHRNELIDGYYDAIDDEEFAAFERVFADDIEYQYPDRAPMHGIDEVRTFFEEEREHGGSTHTVTRRIDDGAVTACEGTVEAEGPDGSTFEADFVGVFEFDEAAEAISRIGVYTG
jgi:ketosteroid isomerase-like protein